MIFLTHKNTLFVDFYFGFSVVFKMKNEDILFLISQSLPSNYF